MTYGLSYARFLTVFSTTTVILTTIVKGTVATTATIPSQTISITETEGMMRRRQATATPLSTASSLMSAASAAASTGGQNQTILNLVASACGCLIEGATTGVDTVTVTSTSVCTLDDICAIDLLNASDAHPIGLRLYRRDDSQYCNIGCDVGYGQSFTISFRNLQ